MDAGNPNCYTGDGSIVYDLGPNKSDGSLGTTTFNPANLGAFVIDASKDFIQTHGISGYSYTEAHTYSAWIYPVTVSGYKWIIQNNDSATPNGTSLILDDIHADKAIGFICRGGAQVRWGSAIVNINEWSNVTTVYHGNLTVSFYKNGVFDVSIDTGAISWTGVNYNPGIGSTPEGSNNYTFQGRIATAQIYNRALNDVEVLQNYNALKGRYGL